jgi:AraC-like DNA-binding protein
MSSDEQQPSAAEYRRTDKSKAPTSLLGQQAAVEGMVAAKGWQQVEGDNGPDDDQDPEDDDPDGTGPDEDQHDEPTIPAEQMAAVEDMAAAAGFLPTDKPKLAEHNRKMLRRQFGTVDESTPAGRFQAQMLAAMAQFEHERHAEILAAGGDPDEDRDALEYVRWIADGYEQNRDNAKRRLEHLNQLANELSLDDARALRIAAEAVKKATPQIIRIAADVDAMTPVQIAEELGMTESYVYRLLREHREQFDG